MKALHKIPEKPYVWQLQEAKAMFSEVVKASSIKPQKITIHGKETAVILSIDKYNNLVHPKQSLFEFIQSSPLYNVDLELPFRQSEKMREVKL